MDNLNYTSMLEAIIQLKYDKLNDWESTFCEDLWDKCESTGILVLSDKQKAKIVQIHDKYIKGI